MVLWSTGFPATAVLLETWHPLVTTMCRLGIGALVLLPIIWWQGNISDFATAPWKKIFLVGGTPLMVSTICMNVGILYSNPVTASILATMMPPAAFLLAMIDGEQRLTVRWTCGILLAVLGGVWASLHGDLKDIGFQGGEFLLVIAVVSFAWYSRATVKHLSMLSVATKTSFCLLTGTLITCSVVITAQITGLAELYYDPAPHSIVLMLWIGAIANGSAMFLWLGAVSRVGVTIGAFHQNLVPFYVMLTMAMLGSPLVLQQVVGAVIVVGGVLITQWPTGYSNGNRGRQSP